MASETFKKRQKETARKEKKMQKVARRLERKNEKARGENNPNDEELEWVNPEEQPEATVS